MRDEREEWCVWYPRRFLSIYVCGERRRRRRAFACFVCSLPNKCHKKRFSNATNRLSSRTRLCGSGLQTASRRRGDVAAVERRSARRCFGVSRRRAPRRRASRSRKRGLWISSRSPGARSRTSRLTSPAPRCSWMTAPRRPCTTPAARASCWGWGRRTCSRCRPRAPRRRRRGFRRTGRTGRLFGRTSANLRTIGIPRIPRIIVSLPFSTSPALPSRKTRAW